VLKPELSSGLSLLPKGLVVWEATKGVLLRCVGEGREFGTVSNRKNGLHEVVSTSYTGE